MATNDELLRRALGYRRFAGVPRVLVLDSGYYVVEDVVAAAGELGWAVARLPALDAGPGDDRFVAALLGALVAHRPDFVFTVNHCGFDGQGVLAGLLGRYQVPVASWFVDHPLPILADATGLATPGTQVFCLERTALPWLGQQGFVTPEHLPTAVGRAFSAGRVDTGRARALGRPLGFLGDTWWRKGHEEPPAWAREAAQALREAEGLDKGFVAARLSQAWAALPAPRSPVLLAALAQAACAERVALVRALQPLGLRVHGDPRWRELAPGVDLGPPLDPLGESAAFYAGTAVNVNHTAVHMPTAVNQRVWEVPAAGGFLLTDAQEDALAHFREGEEIAVYRDPEEAAEKARYYLNHPAEREAIAARARARVEQGHRYADRLRFIVAVMRARFA